MTRSCYLLGNGWLPSPSTHGDGEGAWEHPQLSRVPDNFCLGLYHSDLARWPTGIAVVLQAVEEKRLDDEAAEAARWRVVAEHTPGSGWVTRLEEKATP
jgi:hypothetical protein